MSIFTEFIALIVRCRMYTLLKDELEKLETKPNYMTVPAAIRELEKIEMVRGLEVNMNLSAIHHIAIICSGRESALSFYHQKLGFPVIRETYRPERNDWKIDLSINDMTELELFIMDGHPVRASYPEAYGLRHLAFKVDSVADTVAELEEKGIECEPIRSDSCTGKPMTFFRDPDGLPIEIHE